MKKQHLFIILSLVLLGFVFGIIQYYQALKTEDVSAVTVGIPNPGHSLAQLECSADSLCVDTTNNRVGIGTVTPSEKLSVAGTIGFETLKKDYTLTLGDGTYTAETWYALSGNPGAQYGDGMSYLAQVSIQYDGRYSHWQRIGSGLISTVAWANSNYSYVTIPLTCHSETTPITAYLMQKSTGMDHDTVIAIKFDTTLTVANGGYIRVYLKRIF